MRSMTGFGQARREGERHALSVRLRSVNGRYLDLNLRLREEYRASEGRLRDLLGTRLFRGRVEVSVDIRPVADRRAEVEVHGEVIRALHHACQGLIQAGLVSGDLTVGDLLRIPEAVEVRPLEDDWGSEDEALLLAVAEEALSELITARSREGEKLAAVLEERLVTLDGLVEEMRSMRPSVQEEMAAGLRRRLGELLGDAAVDEGRLAQEMAVLADRADISEELDRLAAHLEHFRAVTAEDGALGKRLDFLAQEIFRELNTLGAKSRNAAMTRLVLDAKVLAEQLREQVQNVE